MAEQLPGSPSKPDLQRLRIDKSGSRRRSPWPGRVVTLAILVGLGWAAWTWGKPWIEARIAPSEDAGPRGPEVATARALLDSAGDVSGNGYVVARRQAALSTVLSGRLVELKVEEGSRVAAGEVIARIQWDDYRTSLDQAERARATANTRIAAQRAEVEAAKAALEAARTQVEVARRRVDTARTQAEEARREAERQRGNFDEGIISQSDWDAARFLADRLGEAVATAEAEVAAAEGNARSSEAQVRSREAAISPFEAALKEAEAAVESARILLEKTYVRAPFAGIIVEKNAEEGEVVASTGAGGNSRGSVATLVDLATLEVQIEMPEKRIAGIVEGMSASVYLDADPRQGWSGRVRQVWPKADRQKGSIEIRVAFEERPEVLRPDMGARVVFHLGGAVDPEKRDAVTVPRAALRGSGDARHVFVVRGDVVARVAVTVSEDEGARAVVTAGLAAGDRVLLAPPAGLRDGDPVEKAVERTER